MMARARWSPPADRRGPAAGDPMSCAELVVAREFLGITGTWLAQAAHVDTRTERRYEAGDVDIPATLHAIIATLEQHARDAVAQLCERLALVTDRGVLLLRTDVDYQAAAPAGIAMPARWHHHVVARAALTFPDVMLAFEGEKAPLGTWLRPVAALADLGDGIDEIRHTTTRTSSPNSTRQ